MVSVVSGKNGEQDDFETDFNLQPKNNELNQVIKDPILDGLDGGLSLETSQRRENVLKALNKIEADTEV